EMIRGSAFGGSKSVSNQDHLYTSGCRSKSTVAMPPCLQSTTGWIRSLFASGSKASTRSLTGKGPPMDGAFTGDKARASLRDAARLTAVVHWNSEERERASVAQGQWGHPASKSTAVRAQNLLSRIGS